MPGQSHFRVVVQLVKFQLHRVRLFAELRNARAKEISYMASQSGL